MYIVRFVPTIKKQHHQSQNDTIANQQTRIACIREFAQRDCEFRNGQQFRTVAEKEDVTQLLLLYNKQLNNNNGHG